MSMRMDEFVWLHGGRVIRRKLIGKSEIVVSNVPLLLDDSYVQFDIAVNSKSRTGQHMRAVRLDKGIVCWEM